jgi:hypothetical protein
MDINLFYEDSPTIIRLRTHSLDRKKRITRITIIPDEFAKEPNVYGSNDSGRQTEAKRK